jgi:hypothetical protein
VKFIQKKVVKSLRIVINSYEKVPKNLFDFVKTLSVRFDDGDSAKALFQ